jgi:hypothetical protein
MPYSLLNRRGNEAARRRRNLGGHGGHRPPVEKGIFFGEVKGENGFDRQSPTRIPFAKALVAAPGEIILFILT